MIVRFVSETESEMTLLDINNVNKYNGNKLNISMETIGDEDEYLSVNLDKEDVKDMINILKRRLKDFE